MTKTKMKKGAKPDLHVVQSPPEPPKPQNIKMRFYDVRRYWPLLDALPALPVQAEYAVMRIKDYLEREDKRYETMEKKIYAELGELKVDEDGTQRHVVPDDKMPELQKRVLELRNMEIELPFYPVPEEFMRGCREPVKLRGLEIFFIQPSLPEGVDK